MYKLSRSNCIFQRTSISHVIVLWSLLHSTLVGMVGFSASTLVYRMVWWKTTFPRQRWAHKAYQGNLRLAPKPLLRQLKRRPMRPHRSLWRNSLENLSAGRDNAAGCQHVFLQKIIINQQRPLSADLLIPELEKTWFQGKPTTQKNNAFSFTVQAFLFSDVFREWSPKSIQYMIIIWSIDIHSLVDEAQDSNISEIALRIC